MLRIIHPADQRKGSNGTIAFEGRPHGGAVSFFLVDAAPGEGQALHTHPYSETWIVTAGRAAMTAGAETFTAAPGDIIVIPAETPHAFKSIGPERLRITCIHACDHFIQTWVSAAA